MKTQHKYDIHTCPDTNQQVLVIAGEDGGAVLTDESIPILLRQQREEYEQMETVIEHVQEHAKFYGEQLDEPYGVIWSDETFWAAEPGGLVKLIVEFEEGRAGA